MNEARALARELSELSARLAEVAARVGELEHADSGAEPADGACLLTCAEVMKRTKLPRGTVYRLAREGGLGAVKVGERGVRFSERGVAEWIRDGGSSVAHNSRTASEG